MGRGRPARMPRDILVEVSRFLLHDSWSDTLLTACEGGVQNAARKGSKDKKEEKSDKKDKKPMGMRAIRGFV